MEKKIIIGIYKITSPTGKIYIGLSTDIYSRWKQHKSLRETDSDYKLCRSLKKHGIENHIFEIIYTLEIYDKDKLNYLEAHYGKLFNVTNKRKGLNIRECGGSRGKHSEESKQKNSESHKGKKASAETKAKQSKSQTGKKRSAETKQKQRESKIGKKRSTESKSKQGESNKGKPTWNKGIPMTEEAIIKSVETKKRKREEKLINGTYVKRVVSEETKAKKLETQKRNREEQIANGTYVKYVTSLETKKKQSDAKKGKKLSSESIDKGFETRNKNCEEKLMKVISKNTRINNHISRTNKKIIRQERLTNFKI